MTDTPFTIPAYKCHKEVVAFKIMNIGREFDEHTREGINFLEPEIAPGTKFPVSLEYIERHQPKVGGYYVRYNDGYASFSPAEAFEDGYTPIDALTPDLRFKVGDRVTHPEDADIYQCVCADEKTAVFGTIATNENDESFVSYEDLIALSQQITSDADMDWKIINN